MPAPIALVPLVALNGSPLSATAQAALVELRIERQFQVPGRCTLRFSDPGYVLAGSGEIHLGTPVEVSDPGDSSLQLIGAEVTGVAVDQRVGEQPELVVTAHDKSHRLGRATKVTSYLNMTYSDVVSKLATSAGLSPDVSSTTLTIDYLMQADSDLGLLTELARRVGFDWWVDDVTLHFAAPSEGSTVSLPLGEDLRSFSVRATGHHPDKVVVDGWDRDEQQLVTATASEPTRGVTSSSALADLVAQPGSAFGQATVTTAGLSAHSQEEATQLSQALLDRGQACAVSAQGVTAGNGKVKPGVAVEVSLAGPLSGTYPVTRVEHVYRPGTGYLTRFHAGDRRPSGLVDALSGTRLMAASATHHPGLTVGQVTNINDDEHKGRVKVRYPGLSSEDETGWARLVAVGGGADRGTVFIPEVDDEVLVGFEGGDPRQPVVLGGLFGAKSTIPTPSIEGGTVQARGITSRLGHVVQLLDGTEEAQQAIVLQLAGGESTVHLGKDKLSITLPSGTPLEINVGDSSLSFSDSGALSISAPSVSIKAEQQIELNAAQVNLSADTQLSLQSDAAASLKGASLELQSEGPLNASGSPVMVN